MHEYLNQAICSIIESVSFPSTQGEAREGNPFGKENHDCLKHFLALAKSLGFETKDYDGYVGEVLFGSGEEFAILAHLDVVPAGDGWNTPPFTGTLKDGKIFGRGTMDDKGPAVCCLYAMKALKDKGFIPKKRIKLIVGCNEETGWACIRHYNEVAHMPETGFSPDADFPVIYSEKGILHAKVYFPVENAPFTAVTGGTAGNMVCDYCTAISLETDENKAAKLGLTVEGTTLSCRGKSAHGSTPEKGVNAILPILSYFEDNAGVKRAVDCLFRDVYGLKKTTDGIDTLTLSPNVVSYAGGCLQFVCDIRYPAAMQLSEIFALLDLFGVKYEVLHDQLPLRVDKDNPLVTTLLGVFEECTGIKAEPVSIGGGTYARALKQGVAFGPEMPGDEAVIHQPNEYITVERVDLLLRVYEKAIARLTV